MTFFRSRWIEVPEGVCELDPSGVLPQGFRASGVAAGIKLIPLVFIPYLLLTRRFRAAAMATGTFAATVVLGFLVVPGDSTDWWLHGLFFNGSRTGFVGWGGNQSLRAILTRFAGSIHGATAAWMAEPRAGPCPDPITLSGRRVTSA